MAKDEGAACALRFFLEILEVAGTKTYTDGILNIQIGQILSKGTGKIHGVDSSVEMIKSSKEAIATNPALSKICTFEGTPASPFPFQKY